jgi:hypothetical protein
MLKNIQERHCRAGNKHGYPYSKYFEKRMLLSNLSFMIFYIQSQALSLNAVHQKRVAYLVLTKSQWCKVCCGFRDFDDIFS